MAVGFWNRATLALALALYGWSMMGVELYLRAAPLREGPDRGLGIFRRQIMGHAVLAIGGAAVLAALVLAILGLRRRAPALAALALCVGFVACLAAIWPP